ncbi:DUF1674 domain-containing protein [Roseococcus sp. SYP-B2431]|uniref:DUF1674 domain-containing protein n=1 Tax=Roseococcus sp. SYP-B2431 TaxID=2496640 RepID=UPI00103AD75C|nr:DUF1674 domain-containing protein [Roseococcus sp. SYP-B2431]TCH97216.1 DUF1674 domain-containing protein [Roseococcus sp. SYP-B2431]
MTEDEKPPASPPGPSATPRTAPPLTKLDRPKRPYSSPQEEDGGPKGPEPTRYNDWERKGRVSDF